MGSLLLLALLAQTPEPPPPVAVLPVTIKADLAAPRDASTLLTSVLTDAMAQTGKFKVISADEVAALLQQEAERQQLGCEDDGCLAELAGALGARLVVTGDVTRAGEALLWSVGLVDQVEGTVVRRTSAPGSRLDELVGQVGEIALILAGDEDAVALTGPKALKRFGLTSEADLAAFAKFRRANPQWSTQEAFTHFIVERNQESPVLAGATSAALSIGAVATALSTLGVGIAMGTLGAFGLLAPLVLPLQGCVGLAGLAAGAAGLVMLAVDGMDRGKVPVTREGCCRQRAVLQEAQRRASSVQRAAAIATVLSGIALLGSGWALLPLGLFLVTGTSGLVNSAVGGPPGDQPAHPLMNEIGLSPVSVGLHAVGVVALIFAAPVTLAAGVATTATGAVMLFRGPPPLVDDTAAVGKRP